MPYTN